MTRRNPITWIIAVLVVLTTSVGVGVAQAASSPAQRGTSPASGPLRLLSSGQADRRDPAPLDRGTVRGNVHVSVEGDVSQVVSVTFYLDDPLAPALRVERAYPYDFAGGAPDGSAQPFDTRTLADGVHVVLAEVALRDGSMTNLFAKFRVDNTGGPVPSPTVGRTPTATPSPSATRPRPDPTPEKTNAPVPPPGRPSGGRCPALPAYPNAACTGVPGDTKLTTIAGNYRATKKGEVIDGKRITGSLSVNAPGVVIRNSEVLGGVNNFTGSGSYPYTIEDSTVGPASGCVGNFAVGAENFTARRVHIRNFSDGFRVSGDDILIEDSLIRVCTHSSNHSDGIQGHNGGANVVIRHNTVDQRGVQNSTSPIFMADGTQGALVEDNLFIGGGYAIRLHSGSYTARNNAVVDKASDYGPVMSDCSGVRWSGNRLVEIDGNYQVVRTVRALPCTGG